MKNESKTFLIEGMSCASCVKKVETTLKNQVGVNFATVNLASETASVNFDSNFINIQKLESSIAHIGYRMKLKTEKKDTLTFWNTYSDLIVLIVSIILTLPLLSPMVGNIFNFTLELPNTLQLLLAIPVQFIIGFRYYKNSYRALKNFSANMDVLITIGTSAAFGLSVYLGFYIENSLHQHLYFESSSVIITLVLLGKYLEKRAKQKTTSSLRALDSLRPEIALVMRNGEQVEIPVFKIVKGDHVIIRPGDRIPIDGIILEGQSIIDESLITGESLPMSKDINDKVVSGSLNTDGLLKVIAINIESESVLSQIIRLMEEAHNQKAPIHKLVDRVSEIFAPGVIIIALATLFIWKLMGAHWETAIIYSVSVLVIACPCALGLATPTALMVGRGLAARYGILIKEAESLEKAHQIRTVIFDKTGTLTEGQPQLIETHLSKSVNFDESTLLSIAYSLQKNSSHPLAKAVIVKAKTNHSITQEVHDFHIIAGKGSEAKLSNGDLIQIGSYNWMKELGYDLSAFETDFNKSIKLGHSTAWIANLTSHTVYGYHSFADQIKPDSLHAIQQLQKMGLEIILLSGDKNEVAALVAAKLNISKVIAEVLPKEKLQNLLEIRRKFGSVAMVGDGINDAPALAAADLGIAMGQGTDVAIGASSITLMKSNPLQVVQAIKVAKATFRKIKQNLFWAFAYNAIGIPLACMGKMNPMFAAAAMSFSSICVIGNSLLLNSTDLD